MIIGGAQRSAPCRTPRRILPALQIRPARSPHSPRSRSICVRATAAAAVEDLKQQLIDMTAPGDVQPNDEMKQLLEQLKEAVGEATPKISQDQLVGRYSELLNTTFLLGPDKRTTLGTLTFRQFNPVDLQIRVDYVELVQGVDAPDQYNTRAYFEVVDGEHTGMKGVQTAIAKYGISSDKPNRQDVTFTGIRIEADPNTDMQQWLGAMKNANSNMAEDGVAEIAFPNHMPAFRDFLILDDSMHLTVGNRGSFVAVKPL